MLKLVWGKKNRLLLKVLSVDFEKDIPSLVGMEAYAISHDELLSTSAVPL